MGSQQGESSATGCASVVMLCVSSVGNSVMLAYASTEHVPAIRRGALGVRMSDTREVRKGLEGKLLQHGHVQLYWQQECVQCLC